MIIQKKNRNAYLLQKLEKPKKKTPDIGFVLKNTTVNVNIEVIVFQKFKHRTLENLIS